MREELKSLRDTNPLKWLRLCQALDPVLPSDDASCRMILARFGDSRVLNLIDRAGEPRLRAAAAFSEGRTSQRIPSYTESGEPVLLDCPEITDVRTGDFSVLSRVDRYGGAVKVSVGHHLKVCVAIAIELGIHWKKVFLHDLHEAYIGEIPIGFKGVLPNFDAIEDRWIAHVYKHYNIELDPASERQIKLCDLMALAFEVTMYDHPASADILRDIGASIAFTGVGDDARLLSFYCGELTIGSDSVSIANIRVTLQKLSFEGLLMRLEPDSEDA